VVFLKNLRSKTLGQIQNLDPVWLAESRLSSAKTGFHDAELGTIATTNLPFGQFNAPGIPAKVVHFLTGASSLGAKY
jgi:hypothetical protein